MRKFARPALAGACLLGGLFGVVGVVGVAVAVDLWNTGLSRYVLFNAAGGIGTPTYLGFSSGLVGPTLPQRWLAQPFELSADATVTVVQAYGFIPAANEYDDVVVKIWSRPADDGAGNPVTPTIAGGNLLHDITVAPAPALIDFLTPDDGVNDPNDPDYTLRVPVNVCLPAGRYYATVHAGTPTSPNTTSNFAWFANAPACPQGTAFIDTTGLPGTVVPPPWPYMWRSATHPPGYALYQLRTDAQAGAPSYYQDPLFPHDGDPGTCADNPDNEDLYVAGLRIEGTVAPCGGGCTGDIDGDGDTDLSDLATLLANFGSIGPGLPGDLDGDGDVDLSDLALILANFGCS